MTTPKVPQQYPAVPFEQAPARSGDDRRPNVSNAPTRGAAPSSAPRSPAAVERGAQNAAKPAGSQISQILDFGMGFRGTPYQWGGAAPGGFDCSGLLYYMYGKAGVKLPRVSADQARAGTGVSAKDARPGDLVAFDWNTGRPGIDHIGVYLGNGMMLVAPKTGDVVKVQKVDLGKAAAIRRVMPEAAYTSMRQANGTYVYASAQGVKPAAAASPKNSGPTAGGGDIGNNPGGGNLPVTMAPGDVTVGAALDVFGTDAKLDPEEAMAQYGLVAELADTVPDVKRLLAEAIAGGWSALKLEAELRDTKWWKTTQESQRKTELLKATNPGEYKRQRQEKIDQLVIASRNLGVAVDNKKIETLADRAMSLGWSDQEIGRYLAADVKVKATGNTGTVAVTVDTLKEQASQYGVPMSIQALQTWTTQIMRGMVPEASFQSYLKEQAKSLFPSLAAAIDAGVTVEQYVEPYRQITAQTLELNPADLRLDNTHMQKALYAHGKDGSRTQMTLSEYQEYLRGTDGFRKTRQAQETAAGFVNSITEMFGKVAT